MYLQNINLRFPNPKPILLKIAPDLNWSQLDDVLDVIQQTQLSGIVATNTTTDRTILKTNVNMVEEIGRGGLSGRPLKEKSTEIVKYISKKTNQQLPIIAVGGIFNADDAKEKIDAGASLIQVYTGFIYQGPNIAKNICQHFIKR